MTSKTDKPEAADTASQVTFGEGFLRDHLGAMISDPRIALVELIANAYDAGANSVRITLPSEMGQPLVVEDDGVGMSLDEFKTRWMELSYNRLAKQGREVVFPKGAKKSARTAFGRNGKGRHSAFCFSDSYTIESSKDGVTISAEIDLQGAPFRRTMLPEQACGQKHGTKILATCSRHLLQPAQVIEAVGSKFIVDPSFSVFVNGSKIELTNLDTVETHTLDVPGIGPVTIHAIDGKKQDKTAHLRGITWWVNNRMVGEPSWEELDGDGAYLDGRTAEAKRFSFVVNADHLTDAVKADWSGFHAGPLINTTRKAVHSFVVQRINMIMAGSRKQRKKDALAESRSMLKELAPNGRLLVGSMLDAVLEKCPSVTERDLARMVSIMASLEQARSGYELLKQLATCSTDDLDRWNDILDRWSATNAGLVLDELERRISVIARMQLLINDKMSDELHDLQPLFERGLWMFGPEYEAVDFRSNRGLTEVVQNFLGGTEQPIPAKKRPDFVVLPDTSIGFYGAPSFSKQGEVGGLRKVLIVELKRGGFEVTQKEMDQARGYANQIRKAGHVQRSTQIHAYVLGATLAPDLDDNRIGEHTIIEPITYSTILERAHARTFNLQRLLGTDDKNTDAEIEELLSIEFQPELMQA